MNRRCLSIACFASALPWALCGGLVLAAVGCERTSQREAPPAPSLEQAFPVAPPGARGPGVEVVNPTSTANEAPRHDAGAPKPVGVPL